jgi:hypothetical protein
MYDVKWNHHFWPFECCFSRIFSLSLVLTTFLHLIVIIRYLSIFHIIHHVCNLCQDKVSRAPAMPQKEWTYSSMHSGHLWSRATGFTLLFLQWSPDQQLERRVDLKEVVLSRSFMGLESEPWWEGSFVLSVCWECFRTGMLVIVPVQ